MWNVVRILPAGFLTLGLAIIALVAPTPEAIAQEHRAHPAADMPLHEKFYSTWYMPDQPTKSCCNKAVAIPRR